MSGQPSSFSQASRSTAIVMAWHQARLTVQDFDGRCPSPVSLPVRTCGRPHRAPERGSA